MSRDFPLWSWGPPPHTLVRAKAAHARVRQIVDQRFGKRTRVQHETEGEDAKGKKERKRPRLWQAACQGLHRDQGGERAAGAPPSLDRYCFSYAGADRCGCDGLAKVRRTLKTSGIATCRLRSRWDGKFAS